MKFELKSWLDRAIKFAVEAESWKMALEIAVKEKADLSYIELPYRARLDGANLVGARLDRAILVGVRLGGASLVGANLDRANLDGASLVGANLVGASLDGASLVGASLDGARLDRARLVGARLVGASLDGAKLVGANLVGARLDRASLVGVEGLPLNTVLPTGETFEVYLRDVVPALLTAGGKSLAEVATKEHWECHSWENCPMSAAFGATKEEQTPLILRPRVKQFVQLFDAGLIPLPTGPEEN